MIGKFSELYFDGACEPNPGKAGAGAYIKAEQIGIAIGLDVGTNNYAEWMALIIGLEQLLDRGYNSVRVIGDSQLVLNCACGKWRTHKKHLQLLKTRSDKLIAQFSWIEFVWVKRNYNTVADSLAERGYALPADSIEINSNVASVDPDYLEAAELYRKGAHKKEAPTKPALNKQQELHLNRQGNTDRQVAARNKKEQNRLRAKQQLQAKLDKQQTKRKDLDREISRLQELIKEMSTAPL